MLKFKKAGDFDDVIYERSGYVARITLNSSETMNTGVKDLNKALAVKLQKTPGRPRYNLSSGFSPVIFPAERFTNRSFPMYPPGMSATFSTCNIEFMPYSVKSRL